MRTLLPLLVLLPTASAQDDFLEAFALAADRATALERLVPGTAQAYYFQCLERQHAGDLDAVERVHDEEGGEHHGFLGRLGPRGGGLAISPRCG